MLWYVMVWYGMVWYGYGSAAVVLNRSQPCPHYIIYSYGHMTMWPYGHMDIWHMAYGGIPIWYGMVWELSRQGFE